MLVAMATLVVILGMVYGAFSSVVSATETARTTAEELRIRQFLTREMTTTFSTAYTNWTSAQLSADLAFFGETGDGPEGPQDAIQFVSTAPVAGAKAMPGDLKIVSYAIIDQSEAESALAPTDEAPEDQPRFLLQSMETPILAGGIEDLEDLGDEIGDIETEGDYVSPSWSVPVSSFDLAYYDGEEWQEEWDSSVEGMMPWCLRVRINFAKSDEERGEDIRQGFDPEEDPDMELVLPIPTGIGIVEPFPVDGLVAGQVDPDAGTDPDPGGST
jgi:hypothetical protein